MIASGASAISESSAIGRIHQARLGFGVPTAVGAGAGAARRFPRGVVARRLRLGLRGFRPGIRSRLRLRERGRPVEPLRHPVVDPPLAVAALDELDVGGHRRPARPGLREEEDLQADGVLVGVLHEAPAAEAAVGGGVRHDRQVAAAPLLAGEALAQARRGDVPRAADVLAVDRGEDELAQHLAHLALLRLRERRALRLGVAGLVDQRAGRGALVSRLGEVDAQVDQRRGDDQHEERWRETTPPPR